MNQKRTIIFEHRKKEGFFSMNGKKEGVFVHPKNLGGFLK
jgi:hypothetical protein